MSVSRGSTFGEKVVLPRKAGTAGLWRRLFKHYRRINTRSDIRLKYLAAFALREVCEWEEADVAKVLGVHKTAVGKAVAKVRRELRDQFEQE